MVTQNYFEMIFESHGVKNVKDLEWVDVCISRI